MTSPRFYCPVPMATGTLVELPENAARHACRVLRLREGDGLVLFDSTGGEYVARIASVNRDRVSADVLEWRDAECESPIRLTLVQALQTGEKMDMTVQKAVELGVQRIVPVASRRSVLKLQGERAERRVEHWQGVATAACEQCGRNRLPEVTAIMPLERWLERLPQDAAPNGERVLRLMLVPGAELTLDQLPRPQPGSEVELLIGAEGGLAPEEVARAKEAGYLGLRLGPRILRTETAGLAALAAIQCLWGDFGGDSGKG
ncbi:16S rRNA (uracil(1498)-N(3))-methyltransferase [Propionivibrio limicola]|uniref:16S rRNA (uracil(1498)-N(3))-methyltransferase n=1 Tax=Propionivibrio limicola TaxID=167645 RepID=UPI0012928C4D|nr:16S rRNA (uracil(1498)-N(3))-methyltransferase [Propionivibrio limicola]